MQPFCDRINIAYQNGCHFPASNLNPNPQSNRPTDPSTFPPTHHWLNQQYNFQTCFHRVASYEHVEMAAAAHELQLGLRAG
jgi:hypothetical protein